MAGRALVVVDVQPGFCEGGDLPVEGGNAVAEEIASFVTQHRHEYDAVVATRDFHIDPAGHFADEPDFRETWPVHCVAGTPQAELHPALRGVPFDAVFDKGAYAAAYSGFEAVDPQGRPLAAFLHDRGIDEIDVAGLATDYCVAATARDGLGEGFRVRVLTSLSAGVAPETTRAALDDLRAGGAEIVASR